MPQCTATTRAGRRCRSSAVRDSDVCRVHRQPADSETIGFYDAGLLAEERRLLAAIADRHDVAAELLALRVMLRRALIVSRDYQEMAVDDFLKTLTRATTAARAIGQLARQQRQDGDDEPQAIQMALDILSDELGRQL